MIICAYQETIDDYAKDGGKELFTKMHCVPWSNGKKFLAAIFSVIVYCISKQICFSMLQEVTYIPAIYDLLIPLNPPIQGEMFSHQVVTARSWLVSKYFVTC